ncbi:hypothetical protein X011_07955 [Mycobacterium tuberculosis variant microti OV254]|nr:hypothetical protein [Mycobacterium simiae]PLV52995.1 hypothetical protein X011_07955 [Mycobacterium tuberculosis variant microti OV254]
MGLSPFDICDFVGLVVAWSLADLAGRTSPGPDEVAAALSFRQFGAHR